MLNNNSLLQALNRFDIYITPSNIFLIALLLLLQSCSVERKLASGYIKSNQRGTILLMRPSYLEKKNTKDTIYNYYSLSNSSNKDSVLLSESLFLKNVEDEVFFNKYSFILTYSLQELDFKVLDEINADSFLLADPPAWILNPAQFELDEELIPYNDYHFYDSVLFEKSFLLNRLTLHTWLELSPLNPGEHEMDVLYSKQTVTDKIEGRFRRNIIWGDVRYDYKIKPVNLSHVYDASEFIARKHAAFLFDYMMNAYVKSKLPSWRKQNHFFQYDSEKKRLKPYKDGFILIKESTD